MENNIMDTKKVFGRIGLTLFVMTFVVIITQSFIAGFINGFSPDFEKSIWYNWLLIGISLYCVGFPIFLIMMRKIPNSTKGEIKKLPFSRMLVIFFICMVTTYFFNIVGQQINTLIALLKGADVINPLETIVNASSIIPTLIFAGILSPIIEEIMFRGILLDKLRMYGDKLAIWVTALTFALFHGNLSQFFYAFALGLIFAYIAVKTNTIRYTVILHVIINIVGSVVMPALALSENTGLVALAGFIIIIIFAAGITLFIMNFKKVKHDWKQMGSYEIDKKVIYGNIGMIGFYIVCLYLFIITIIA